MVKNEQLKQLSNLSKTLQFDDGTIILPLVSEEVMYMDQDFVSFDAISNYDLVCMVKRIIKGNSVIVIVAVGIKPGAFHVI